MPYHSPSLIALALPVFFATSSIAEKASPNKPTTPLFPEHPINEWVKRTPLPGGPPSPRLGYEGATVWNPVAQRLVRYGGHNQGGGGEQGSEVWTLDLATAEWELMEPDWSPPGVCCNAQNLCLPSGRYLRFPKFSGGHGWQYMREVYLNDSPVWVYDFKQNRWRDRRPYPAPKLAPYRAASWDSHHQLAVVFGGEGSREGTLLHDPWRNEWRFPKPETQPTFRSGGNMAYDAARKLHILFGLQFRDDPHTWAYSVGKNEWRDLKPASQPPTKGNDAVLTYDPVHQRVLAVVKVSGGEKFDQPPHEVQTWAFDAGRNEWRRLRPKVEPFATGNRTRNLTFAPEHNLAILEVCSGKPREQQIWTYRYAPREDAPPPPPAPAQPAADRGPPLVEDITVSVVAEDSIELAWAAPLWDKAIAGYVVERAQVEVYSTDELKKIKKNTHPLERPSVGMVRKVGKFVTITEHPIAGQRYTDSAVDLSRPAKVEGEPVYDAKLHLNHLDLRGRRYPRAVFAYRVRAVDSEGRRGGPSAATFTIPSAPKQLFCKEDGGTARLRWAANPEHGIAGYRVYRMDGQYYNKPLPRLTANPIRATGFADPTAGETTRRYTVVAVDTLGQEGFPSSPVWFKRTWARFYEPFVGEWHQ